MDNYGIVVISENPKSQENAMSTSTDTPVQTCAQTAPCTQPAGLPAAKDPSATAPTMDSPSEALTGESPAAKGLTAGSPAGDDSQPPFTRTTRVWPKCPRPRKAAVLPEIARLSLEGHSSRTIGRQLGVPRRTVDRWLGQLRRQWAENAAESTAELFAAATARLESVYRAAMEAWRRSLADKQTTVETPGDDDATPRSTLRKTTQSGQAALLGKAIEAAKEISKFQEQHMTAVCQSREAARCQALTDKLRGLADELLSLPKVSFRETNELVGQGSGVPCRSPIDLAIVLSDLPAEEYRKLGQLLCLNSDRKLPSRGRADVQ